MNQGQWTAVDRYITGLLVPPDEALDGALRDSAAASLPPIAVSPPQGKLLHLLARMQGARLILEIGTLGGYSTIWLARALPAGGRLVTLEVCRGEGDKAGFASVIQRVAVDRAGGSVAGTWRDFRAPWPRGSLSSTI